MLFSFVACKANNDSSKLEYATDFNDKTKELCLVKDGVTDYKIVTPVNYSTAVNFAINELKSLLYSSTGLNFEVITDAGITYDESKY